MKSAGIGLVIMLALVSCSHPGPQPIPPAPSAILVTASRQCPLPIEEANVIRSTPVFVSAMRGHLPHWLPSGFGLLQAYHYPWGIPDTSGAWGYWTDGRCREVTVSFSPGVRPHPTPGPRVGAWTVIVDSPGCGNGVLGPGLCLGYEAAATDGLVGIRAMGVSREEGDRIVKSIPLAP